MRKEDGRERRRGEERKGKWDKDKDRDRDKMQILSVALLDENKVYRTLYLVRTVVMPRH